VSTRWLHCGVDARVRRSLFTGRDSRLIVKGGAHFLLFCLNSDEMILHYFFSWKCGLGLIACVDQRGCRGWRLHLDIVYIIASPLVLAPLRRGSRGVVTSSDHQDEPRRAAFELSHWNFRWRCSRPSV